MVLQKSERIRRTFCNPRPHRMITKTALSTQPHLRRRHFHCPGKSPAMLPPDWKRSWTQAALRFSFGASLGMEVLIRLPHPSGQYRPGKVDDLVMSLSGAPPPDLARSTIFLFPPAALRVISPQSQPKFRSSSAPRGFDPRTDTDPFRSASTRARVVPGKRKKQTVGSAPAFRVWMPDG